jgi:hypothetical protein
MIPAFIQMHWLSVSEKTWGPRFFLLSALAFMTASSVVDLVSTDGHSYDQLSCQKEIMVDMDADRVAIPQPFIRIAAARQGLPGDRPVLLDHCQSIVSRRLISSLTNRHSDDLYISNSGDERAGGSEPGVPHVRPEVFPTVKNLNISSRLCLPIAENLKFPVHC